MTRYRRKLGKPLALDTPAVRAAVNLVLAVEAGERLRAFFRDRRAQEKERRNGG